MAALLAAVLALVPLVITPNLLFYFDVTPKVAVLLLGTAAALPWFAPGSLRACRAGRWFCILLGAQALSLALATVFSTRLELSMVGTHWRRFGDITQAALLLFAAILAAYLAAHPEKTRWFLRVIAAAGIPIALYSVLQYFGWDPWLPARAYHIGEGEWTIVRPPGTLGYVSYLANYLLFVSFSSVGLCLLERNRWWKGLGATGIILGTAGILLSGTRAAILAILAGAVFLLVWFRPRISVRTLGITVVGVVVAALFYFSAAGRPLRSRTRWYFEDPRGGARLALWRDALRLGAHRWATGSGPETFSLAFPPFQSVGLSRAFPDFYHESPHNIFLDAFTAQGALGLAVLLALTGLGFYAAWQAQSAAPKLAGALGASLTAAVVSHQFTVFIVPTALYFYVTIAMLVAAGASGPARLAGRPAGSPRWLKWSAFPLSAVLALIAVRLLAADHSLFRVKRYLESGHTAEAIEEYQRAEQRGLHADLWYSRSMAVAAQKSPDLLVRLRFWQQALQAGIRAATSAEDPHNAWYSLASLYAQHNDFAHTEQSLRSAIATAPHWFKPHWMLAQVLSAAGRREEARAEAAIAANLNGGKNPEVARTLDELRYGGKEK